MSEEDKALARSLYEEAIAEGDLVVLRLTVRGTHQGPFMGLEPTGVAATWPGIDIMRFEDGRIVERWAMRDSAGLMAQLRG
jgi:predicted ester cyclase